MLVLILEENNAKIKVVVITRSWVSVSILFTTREKKEKKSVMAITIEVLLRIKVVFRM